MSEITLKSGERIDDLGRRGYRVIQNKDKFCFGVDSTFLSYFASAREGENILDLCSGTGIVPILMDARYGVGQYVGLEIQGDMVEMANRSCALNHIADHVKMVEGDLKNLPALFPKNSMDVVTVNPPYMAAGNGLLNPDDSKAIARHEICCTLKDVMENSAYVLKPQGRFYMVHRPSRLSEIFRYGAEYRLSIDRIRLIYPHIGDEATMVLVSAVKGAKKMLRVEPPLVIYREGTVYTDEVLHIYRD